MTYGLILAGGKGSRLYPLSRVNKPKQFLNIVDNKTLLYNTLDRVSNIIDNENLYIVTNKEYKKQVFEQSNTFISEDHIIVEPSNKETAVCIALAAIKLLKKDKDAVMLIFPSDHYIEVSDNFYDILNCAIDISNKKRGLVTIGIKAKTPQTGYGYIQIGKSIICGEEFSKLDVYKVERFTEKPSYEIAKDFVLDGGYLWNSGIFCFRADVYLRELEKYLPKIYKGMIEIYKSIDNKDEELIVNKIYNQLDGISIDFGIMQKTRKAYVICGDFYWDDIGSFTSLTKILKQEGENYLKGNVLLEDSKNCLIFGNDNLIINFGVQDLIIVNTGDVILIMDRKREQEVKHLFDLLNSKNEFKDFI